MTAAILIGLATGAALIMLVPIYADAVNFRILQEKLSNQAEDRRRSPFAYLFSYIGS